MNASAPGLQPRALTVECYGLTDCGKERATNEDQFVNATLMRALWVQQSSVPQSTVQYANDRGNIFVVADGVGGSSAGEKASAMAVGAIEKFLLNALSWLFALDGSAGAAVLGEFKQALQSADACVYEAAMRNKELQGMATTLTMAYSHGDDLFVAHAGDSRCYMLRRGVLERLTNDDTLVSQMVESGMLTPEMAAEHELRHVITNFIGGTPGVHAEVHRMKLEPGDVLLLCTDGLTEMVEEAQIAAVIGASANPQQACVELVRIANEKGGRDNVTVIVAHYL